MATKIPQKTQADRLAERWAELDYFARLQAAQDQRRAEQHAQEQAFLQRVAQRRQAEQTAIARGEELPPVAVPTIGSVYANTHAQRLLERNQQEAARIASLSDRQLWFSTLSWREKQAIATWEMVNKMEYPFQGAS